MTNRDVVSIRLELEELRALGRSRRAAALSALHRRATTSMRQTANAFGENPELSPPYCADALG